MKRLFGLILVEILILTCFASCTSPNATVTEVEVTEAPTPTPEPFTLHNGVRFGMSHDEVIQTEEAAGVTLMVAEKTYTWPAIDGLKSKNSLSIAGQPGSTLFYAFDDGKLTTCIYYFYDIGALTGNYSIGEETVLKALKEKYGDPIGTEDNYITVGESFDALDMYMYFYTGGNFERGIRVQESLYQWIQPIENGYVDIMLLTVHAYDMEHRFISYSFRTAEEVEAIIQNESEKETQMNNDL